MLKFMEAKKYLGLTQCAAICILSQLKPDGYLYEKGKPRSYWKKETLRKVKPAAQKLKEKIDSSGYQVKQ